MIVINGTHVQNDNISKVFFHFLEFLIFPVLKRVKKQKMVQNEKKKFLSVALHISGTISHMIVSCGTQV